MKEWLQLEPLIDGVLSLEMTSEQAAFIRTDIVRWKWVVIALHNALQGFMVSALAGSNGFAVLRDKDVKRWHETRGKTQRSPMPKSKLKDFMELYELIKSDRMIRFIHSRKLNATPQQDASVLALHNLRNDFIHFTPRILAVETLGLPEICQDALSVIEFCGWNSGNVVWIQVPETRASLALNSALQAIQGLKNEEQP